MRFCVQGFELRRQRRVKTNERKLLSNENVRRSSHFITAMATVQFKKPSPYKVTPPPIPKEDTTYQQYDLNIKSNSANKLEKFGFALFGVGRAGTIHLNFLVREPQIELLYIVDDDKSKWDKLRNYWSLDNVKFLTSKDAAMIYKDSKVRAVVVASPTHTHEDIVINALDNNKAVFCEKPIAETIETTKACYEKAKKMKQPLLSAFNRRFDPSYANIRERTRKGEIGQVYTVKVCSRDSPLPTIEYLKASGGIFHDCAVHDIDMIIYVLGEYPTRVSVMAKANIPEIKAIDDFDTVAFLLSFDSGALGMIDLSRYSIFGYDQRLEVFGQKGMLKAENQHPVQNVEVFTENATTKAPIAYSFPSRYKKGYELEMLHFLDIIKGKAELCIDVKDTLAVSKIASACEESARTGKAVEIKWSEEELP